MSDSFTNPIVLFGDYGPEVVRYTQIYDPDKDAYIKSWDEVIHADKHYYKRTFKNKVVSFTDVTTELLPEQSPMALGLYEDNPDKETITTGRYVPAVASLVPVDQATDEYPERSVLYVVSVDEETLKTTLAPILFGTGGETSARALDYGNDRFMLYFTKNEGPSGGIVSVSLMPDRKLTLYGWRYYMYRLLRGTQVISGQTPVSETSNGFIPYVSPTAERQTLTASGDNAYTNFSGRSFDVLSARGRVLRCVVPHNDNAFVPTFDAKYISGRIYFKRNSADHYTQLVAGTDYIVNADITTNDIYQHPSMAFRGATDEGVEGWIDIDVSDGRIFYPAGCFLQGGVDNIRAGEPITMETYEFLPNTGDMRLVMSVNLMTKETQIIDAGAVTSRKVSAFDVRLTDDPSTESCVRVNADGVFEIGTQEPIENLVRRFEPFLQYDDGSERIVPVDNLVCYVYGLPNVDTTNPGRESMILFKYFVDINQLSPRFQFGSNQTRGFLSCTKMVRVVDGASNFISKIAVFPLWSHPLGCYKFKYGVYRTDGRAPSFVDDIGAVVVGVEDSGRRQVKFDHGTYMDEYGVVRTTKDISSLFGYIIHGAMAVYAANSGYGASIYTQGIGLRLQNWELSDVPVKWLIGDNKEDDEYSDEKLKYGSMTARPRPYITYDSENASAADKPFQVGLAFNDAAFKEAFYSFINPADDGTGFTYFRIRSFTPGVRYEPLANQYALEGVKYYDPEEPDKEVPVEVGVTDVTKFLIKVQSDLAYFVNKGTSAEPHWVTPEDLPPVGTQISSIQRNSYYILKTFDVASPYIPVDNFHDKFALDQVVKTVDTLGGALPSQTGDLHETAVMGVVALEFARQEAGQYFSIYAVPVEVRHLYAVTNDTEFMGGKTYYHYEPARNGFKVFTEWTPGQPIDVRQEAVFEKTTG